MMITEGKLRFFFCSGRKVLIVLFPSYRFLSILPLGRASQFTEAPSKKKSAKPAAKDSNARGHSNRNADSGGWDTANGDASRGDRGARGGRGGARGGRGGRGGGKYSLNCTCIHIFVSELTEQNHSVEDYVVDAVESEVVEVDTPTPMAHHKLPTAKPPRQIRPLTDGLHKSKLQLQLKRLKAQKTPRTKKLPSRRLRQSLLARETTLLLLEDGEMHHRQRN